MKSIIYSLLVLFVLASCGNNENRSIQEDVAAFIDQHENVNQFGSIQIKSILEKAEYKSIKNLGSTVSKEWETIEKVLNMDSPIYFAMVTPEDIKKPYATFYAFAEVKNRKKIVGDIKKHGYAVKTGKEFDFYEGDEFALGINDRRVVFIAQMDLKDGKKQVEEAFESLLEDCPENKVLEILNTKADIVLGADLEASMVGSAKMLKYDENQIEKIQELSADCYTEMQINFEKGQMVMDMKNHLSDAMKNEMPLEKDAKAILDQIGYGEPTGGLLMNINMKKAQKFMDNYFPNLLDKFGELAGSEVQFGLAMLGKDGIAGYFSGKLGGLMYAKKNENSLMEPSFNFLVGLGKTAAPLADMYLSGVKEKMASISKKGNTVVGFSSKENMKSAGKIKLPSSCAGFGKKPIGMFFKFKGINPNQFGMYNGTEVFNTLDYFYFEFGVDGGKAILKSNNANENILKTLVKATESEVEKQNSYYSSTDDFENSDF